MRGPDRDLLLDHLVGGLEQGGVLGRVFLRHFLEQRVGFELHQLLDGLAERFGGNGPVMRTVTADPRKVFHDGHRPPVLHAAHRGPFTTGP